MPFLYAFMPLPFMAQNAFVILLHFVLHSSIICDLSPTPCTLVLLLCFKSALLFRPKFPPLPWNLLFQSNQLTNIAIASPIAWNKHWASQAFIYSNPFLFKCISGACQLILTLVPIKFWQTISTLVWNNQNQTLSTFTQFKTFLLKIAHFVHLKGQPSQRANCFQSFICSNNTKRCALEATTKCKGHLNWI